MNESKMIVPMEQIENMVYILCGQKVLLDRDLARLYGVETRALVQAVKRNIERFPNDFMFQLDDIELASLMSQIVISGSKGWGGHRKQPFAY